MTPGDVKLTVERLEARYGRTIALRHISFQVRRGETVCIVGPNGAGKSTILKSIAGGVRPTAGKIEFDGRRIDGSPPEDIARAGLSFVPEGRHVFAGLTVEENLLVSTFMKHTKTAGVDLEKVYQHFPRLAERRRQAGGKLSGGEQQMLVIGRALMAKAEMILIDEPSLGLAPKIIDQVYNVLLDLQREENLTLLINEQGLDRARRIADRVLVVREGVVQLQTSRGQAIDEAAMREAYFGFGEVAIT
jgi:branched-chain amino acid transport system ATP-binding protein